MFPFLLQLALLGSGVEDPPQPLRRLNILSHARWSEEVAEICLTPDASLFPVPQGTQVSARVHGDMIAPPTDPGRTVIRMELALPLLSKNGRTILLPVGAQLTGKVHLLRGEFSFVDFQSCLLPDGRLIGLPDDVFRLGPGSILNVQDGATALLTVARPLRMEAFGPTR
jgi:hypothetical protein